MIFDTHAHINFKDFDKDRKEVINRCKKEQVLVLNAGTDYISSKEVIDIARDNEMYASIGLHPLHIKDEDFSIDDYKKLYCKEVVAIGETGIDKHGSNIQKQEEVFLKHIELAKELKLPLIIHCRKAHQEIIDILKSKVNPVRNSEGSQRKISNGAKHPKGVIHCFTGSKTNLRDYLKMGFYIGFNGIIFKMNLKEVIIETPLEKMLLETDCPFLTPPQKEKERNEPEFVYFIAEEIAKIKNKNTEEVINITTKNTKKLFGL